MQINKILAVRNDRFGEFLLNIPAFRALKETFKDARLIVVVNPHTKELAEITPYVDEIIEWDSTHYTLRQKFRVIRFLKQQNIDIAVMLNPSKEFNILSYLARMPIRVGYNRKWGFLLNRKMADEKYLGEKHEVECNLKLVNLIGAQTEDTSLSLIIDDNLINNVIKKFNLTNDEEFIVIHPFTSDPLKQWAPEGFRILAKMFAEKLNLKVILVGGKEEYNKSLTYYSDLGENILNLTGKTSLKELAILLKKSRLLISGDSGPMHLACAAGTPVVAIFRNDIPGKTSKRWGPWGENCSVVERNKLYNISVDEVFNKAKEKLKK